MKVAVIGAGLAGLASAYYLSKQHEVVLFDKKGIGAGASGVCSGLCHPFPGKAAKRSLHAKEGMEETLKLLKLAQPFAGEKLYTKGIYRLPISEEQRETLSTYPDIEKRGEGFWIPDGLVVNVRAYLEALFRLLKLPLQIETHPDFSGFDRLVFCTGYGAKQWDIPSLSFIKGQTVNVQGRSPFNTSTIARGYMAKIDETEFEVGSTYEREFVSDSPDLEKAKTLLPLETFVEEGKIISCQAGVRVSVKGTYLPLIKQLDEKRFLYTGLGSRGLLYHALFAKQLATLIN